MVVSRPGLFEKQKFSTGLTWSFANVFEQRGERVPVFLEYGSVYVKECSIQPNKALTESQHNDYSETTRR